jgi:hypothetical protein
VSIGNSNGLFHWPCAPTRCRVPWPPTRRRLPAARATGSPLPAAPEHQRRASAGRRWMGLATTVSLEPGTDAEIPHADQEQHTTVEPGFRWIKNPAAISSVWLEKPERIAALAMRTVRGLWGTIIDHFLGCAGLLLSTRTQTTEEPLSCQRNIDTTGAFSSGYPQGRGYFPGDKVISTRRF